MSDGATAYGFDADGYLTTRGADSFAYSTRGELAEATVAGQRVTYSHDGFGRRVGRTVGSETTQYLYGNPDNQLQVTAERAPDGTLTTYFYDEGGRMLALERGGTRHYVASDHLGTPKVVTDGAGAVVKVLSHDSYGNQTGDSNPGFALSVGFAGGLADPLTGLVRLGLRDYDPQAGRWTARAPSLYEGRQANLYAYAAGNPVTLVDRTGTFSFGASAYAGVGGGIKLSITAAGFSVCGELGAGAGAGVDIDPAGGLDPDSTSIAFEASAGLGPLASIGAGAELGFFDDCGDGVSRGRLKLSGKGCVGPVCTNLTDSAVGGDPADLGKNVKELFKRGKFGAQAKVAAKACGGLRW